MLRRRASLARIIVMAAGLALPGLAAAAAPVTATPLTYGQAELQRVDLTRPAGGGRGRPLVLYVHGGGWSAGSRKAVYGLPAWASGANLWFGTVGYRLGPEARVEDQAADIGAAIRAAQRDARRHGYDGRRIILIGHSSGAHLAALVATDPRYAGRAFAAIRAVITVDGSALHVPVQLASGQGAAMRFFHAAFGTDPERQAALSPALQASAGDAPRWLIIHVAGRGGTAAQAVLLAAPLRQAELDVTVKAIATDHMGAIRSFGAPGYPANADIDALVAATVRAR
jgi:arylformamidase